MTNHTNYLTKAQYSAAKARLTRALRSGNRQRILDVVDETYAEWDAGDFAYPDDWHRWERARQDVAMDLAFQS